MTASGSIYQTQDTALATTLTTFGVPIPPDSKGRPCPFINIYTADFLRTLRDEKGQPRYAGWEIDDAVRHASSHGIQGAVWYFFRRGEAQSRICKAWAEYEASLREALEGQGPQPTIEVPLELEHAARLACQLLKNRKKLIGEWQKAVPFISIPGDSRRETEVNAKGGDVAVTIGSFYGYWLNTSAEDREHLRQSIR